VEDRVYFYGYQSNPWPFYAAADLVVVPSLQEAFGRTAAEAAILKRPVIGADAGGLQEILPASQRFESGNSAALASALTLALTAAEPVGSVDADALRARHAPVAIAELMMDLIEGAVRA
jgi:glycosyltransferase involved in cell wall biosynthesis